MRSGGDGKSEAKRCANRISIMEFKSVISIIIIQFAFHFSANTLTSKFRIRNPLSDIKLKRQNIYVRKKVSRTSSVALLQISRSVK